METSLILLWGAGVLVAVVVLGILLSKRNASKKDKTDLVVEVPEKEYSQYNGDETEKEDEGFSCQGGVGGDVLITCGVRNKLEDKDEDDEEEEDDRDDYSGSGFNLMSFVTAMVVLAITLTIGITIFQSIGESMRAANVTSYSSNMNMTNQTIEAFASFGDWFGVIIIVGIAGVILAIVFQAFGGMRSHGLTETFI